jgi:Fic family protein
MSDTDDAVPPAVSTNAGNSGPLTRPYKPFPTFEEWLSTPFSPRTFDEYASQLEYMRAHSTVEDLSGAVEVATRWAAIDTGAIEGLYEVERGFTITMAVSSALLENIHAAKGEAVARSVEDALDAYEFVLDVATSSRPITEVWIRELHEKICRSQKTYEVSTPVGPQQHELEKGKYKELPNSPYNFESAEVHSYAPPELTSPEMARFVSELRSDRFAAAHPAVQAAFAHYAFVCIHPFPDGNGRVSRALASAFLYRSPGLPLVIFADQKATYITALEAADAGQYETFVRFISERVVDTIGMVRESIASAAVPTVASQLAQLEAMSTGRGGLPHKELDSVGVRLMEQFADSADAVLAKQFTGTPVTTGVNRSRGYEGSAISEYRVIPSNAVTVALQLSIVQPTQAASNRSFSVLIAKPGLDAPDFLILRGSEVVMEVFLREIYPAVSEALQYRIEAVLETNVREMMTELTIQAQQGLTNQGYSN